MLCFKSLGDVRGKIVEVGSDVDPARQGTRLPPSGFTERFDREFSFHGRELPHKLIERISSPQIVDQGLERNARAAEAGYAAHHLGVHYDGATLLHFSILSVSEKLEH